MNEGPDTTGRLRQIIRVLAQHGFSYCIDHVELKSHLPLTDRMFRKGMKHVAPSARLRMALEELGPTFIKFGQILSTRPDLVPANYITELSKLQDHVKPIKYEQVAETIKQEFGKPIPELFDRFQKEPLASASIGQVHEAWTKRGEHVVVKVIRPGIKNNIDSDLKILFYLSKKFEQQFSEARLWNPTGFVKEFEKQIHRELNYTLEGHNVIRFGKNFAKDKQVKVPKVYEKLSTRNVLTIEYIDGIKITELNKLAALKKKRAKTDDEKKLLKKYKGHKFNNKLIAKRFILSIFRQVFEHRFFHADPHPGNVMVLKNNVIAYLDFGMMKVVDPEFADNISDVFVNLLQFRTEELAYSLMRFDAAENEVDIRELKDDLKSLLEEYRDVELGDINISKVVNQLGELNMKYQARIPSDFFMLGKAIGTAEGICRTLDPSFNGQVVLTPAMHALIRKRTSPKAIAKQVKTTALSFFSRARDLPGRFDRIMKKFEGGRIEFDFRHKDLEEIELEIDRSSNRLTLGIIIAAFIVASALIMQLPTGPLIMGFPAFALIGLSAAGVMGTWVAFAIMKRGRI